MSEKQGGCTCWWKPNLSNWTHLDPPKIDRALRSIISDLDYDLHEALERGEESGAGGYPAVTGDFINYYLNDEEDES